MYKFKLGNNEYSVIGTFKINNKNYLLFSNNNKIFVAIINNGILYKIENDNEFDVIKKIYSNLKFNNHYKENLIELGDIYFNNIKYKSVLDELEKKRYFFTKINGKHIEADKNTKILLNKIYNDQLSILFDNNINSINKTNDIKRKIIKIGKQTIIVFLVIASIIALPKNTIFSNELPNKSINIVIDDDFIKNSNQALCMNTNSEFFIDLLNNIIGNTNTDKIMDILENNNNISKEDKEFIKSIKYYFKENERYFNMNEISYNLKNLKITYDKNNQHKYNLSCNTNACYNKDDNEIVIFISGRMDGSLNTKKVLLHELIHAISNGGFKINNIALTEGITEINAEEYLNTSSNYYYKEQTYARILCELIGTENVKKAFYNGNINIIENKLEEICGTHKEAVKFLSLINDESVQRNLSYSNDKKIANNAKMSLQEIIPQLQNYIKYYYENKYLCHIEEDQVMMAYLDSIALSNNINSNIYDKNDIQAINVIKNYFYSKISNNNQNLKVEYYFENKPNEIQLYNIKKEIGIKRTLIKNGTDNYINDTKKTL